MSARTFFPVYGPKFVPVANSLVANTPNPASAISLCFISIPSGKLSLDLFVVFAEHVLSP